MRTLLILLSALVLITKTESQTVNSLSFQLTVPVGSYKDTYPKTGTGLLFSTTHLLKSKPVLSIGGEVGIIQVSNADKRYKGLYHNKYDIYNISASNYIITLSPKLRIKLHNFKNSATLFADISFGANLFLSYTAISNTRWANNDIIYAVFLGTDLYDVVSGNSSLQIDSSSLHSALALRAGAGLGVEIPIGKSKQLAILLKYSYLYGSRAKYFSHPAIDNITITMEPKESNTSMMLAEAGIRLKIHKK